VDGNAVRRRGRRYALLAMLFAVALIACGVSLRISSQDDLPGIEEVMAKVPFLK